MTIGGERSNITYHIHLYAVKPHALPGRSHPLVQTFIAEVDIGSLAQLNSTEVEAQLQLKWWLSTPNYRPWRFRLPCRCSFGDITFKVEALFAFQNNVAGLQLYQMWSLLMLRSNGEATNKIRSSIQ